MIQKRKFTKVTALTMAFVALFFCATVMGLSAGECEKALFRCLEDPWWHMTLGGPLYCATGYLFCKKYVES
jgi:hypothetical protein